MSVDFNPDVLPTDAVKRVASDGNEWLILLDLRVMKSAHSCNGGGMPWTDTDDDRYEVFFTKGWQTCTRSRDCQARITTQHYRLDRCFLERAEADAYFDELQSHMFAGVA